MYELQSILVKKKEKENVFSGFIYQIIKLHLRLLKKSFSLHIYFSSLVENQNSQDIGKRIKHNLDLSFRVYQKLLYKLPII